MELLPVRSNHLIDPKNQLIQTSGNAQQRFQYCSKCTKSFNFSNECLQSLIHWEQNHLQRLHLLPYNSVYDSINTAQDAVILALLNNLIKIGELKINFLQSNCEMAMGKEEEQPPEASRWSTRRSCTETAAETEALPIGPSPPWLSWTSVGTSSLSLPSPLRTTAVMVPVTERGGGGIGGNSEELYTVCRSWIPRSRPGGGETGEDRTGVRDGDTHRAVGPINSFLGRDQKTSLTGPAHLG